MSNNTFAYQARIGQFIRRLEAAIDASQKKGITVPQVLHTANNWLNDSNPSPERLHHWEAALDEFIIQLLYS